MRHSVPSFVDYLRREYPSLRRALRVRELPRSLYVQVSEIEPDNHAMAALERIADRAGIKCDVNDRTARLTGFVFFETHCERCGAAKVAGQSCGCFDNHCE